MSRIRAIIIHPFLFAAFPTLALLAYNVEEVALAVAARPLLYSLIAAVILFLLAYILCRNAYRAGMVASLILVLIFSYGHLYHAIKEIPGIGQVIGRHRYVFSAYLVFAVLAAWWICRGKWHTRGITQFLNILGVGLLIYPLFQIVRHARLTSEVNEITSILLSLEEPLDVDSLSDLPDIYYIILDTYTRADSMQNYFNFDNEPFLASLREMGFYIADCSRCNHCYTRGSLVTSLNLYYLPDLEDALEEQGVEKDPLPLIKSSLVRGLLEELGYQTVAFETSFFWTTITDADIYLGLNRPSIFDQIVTPFETMLIRNSAGLVWMDYQLRAERDYKQSFYDPLTQYPYSEYIIRELFILENIAKVANIPGPTWTFAHVSIPHPPRVFTPEGDIVDDPGYYSGDGAGPINGEYEIKGYTNEVQFINQRMLEIVESIIQNSSSPPIIILQGDTGGPANTITNILNAYYLRGDTNEMLYPSVSPVNSFRIIFDTYFGASYEILPDVTYLEGESRQPAAETSAACLP